MIAIADGREMCASHAQACGRHAHGIRALIDAAHALQMDLFAGREKSARQGSEPTCRRIAMRLERMFK
jgi:hypothetical protein